MRVAPRKTVAFGAASAALMLALAGCGGASQVSDEVVPGDGNKRKIEPTHVPSVPPSWSPATGDQTVYLTFDDGPWHYTGEVLDILRENEAKATFFQIGKHVNTREALVQRIFDEGHVIGSHTWDHSNLTSLSKSEVEKQLSRTARLIGPQAGPCMRPPYGANNEMTRKVEVSVGMTPVLWNVDTKDWNTGASAASIAEVLRGVEPGDVVLMHDGGGDRSATVAALREVLPELKSRGYSFDVVPVCKPLSPEQPSE